MTTHFKHWNGQTDKQTDKQTDRQTDRQTDLGVELTSPFGRGQLKIGRVRSGQVQLKFTDQLRLINRQPHSCFV